MLLKEEKLPSRACLTLLVRLAAVYAYSPDSKSCYWP
jgi:hypothetical protein